MTDTDDNNASILEERGRPIGESITDPATCMTASIETVDDDRSASLLGVTAIS
jgi:hypothetical protein